jgi:multiple antibiotic resistance protein
LTLTLRESEAVVLFLALFALYSPPAAIASYVPIVKSLDLADRTRLAFGLFVNVAVIAVASLWVGEPVLHILGLSTAALSATGGIALIFESVPLMLGKHDPPVDSASATAAGPRGWRSVVFMPVTFPLTIGGATVGLLIAFRAEAHGYFAVGLLTIAALAYAFVTGISMFTAGRLEPRLSERGRELFDRVAGILLTAIAATLLASGFTRLVISVLHDVKVL